jgi:hypothetical protein
MLCDVTFYARTSKSWFLARLRNPLDMGLFELPDALGIFYLLVVVW